MIIKPQKTAIVFELEINKQRDATLIDHVIEEAKWMLSEMVVVGGGFFADQCQRYCRQKSIPFRSIERAATMEDIRRAAHRLSIEVEGMIFVCVKRSILREGKEVTLPPPNWMVAYRDAMKEKVVDKDDRGGDVRGGDILVSYVSVQ